MTVQFGPAVATTSGTQGEYVGSAPLRGHITSTFGAAEPFRVNPPQPPDWDGTVTARPVGGWGMGLNPHGGVDIDDNLDPNGPILAPAPGEVVEVGYNDDVGFFIRLNHGEGVVSKYLHMLQSANNGASAAWPVGSWIRRGEQIGQVGTTGRWSTGPHLHWSCRVNGVLVDPLSLVVAELTVPDLTELPRPPEPLPVPEIGDLTPEFTAEQWDRIIVVLSMQAHSGLHRGIDVDYLPVVNRNRWTVELGIGPDVVGG